MLRAQSCRLKPGGALSMHQFNAVQYQLSCAALRPPFLLCCAERSSEPADDWPPVSKYIRKPSSVKPLHIHEHWSVCINKDCCHILVPNPLQVCRCAKPLWRGIPPCCAESFIDIAEDCKGQLHTCSRRITGVLWHAVQAHLSPFVEPSVALQVCEQAPGVQGVLGGQEHR